MRLVRAIWIGTQPRPDPDLPEEGGNHIAFYPPRSFKGLIFRHIQLLVRSATPIAPKLMTIAISLVP